MNKYNLLNLLSETIIIESLDEDKTYAFDGIKIPMIQRDYAHGREGASEIRKRFLNSIFEALENHESLELDFIYGSIKQLDAKNYFIPLDGQQRLTTLFLLYWYIGNRELDSKQSIELNNNLANFTYATRATARDFCNKLCEINLTFKEIPSNEIRNASWFFEIFDKDPTVKSMLVMLDAIHRKYQLSKETLFSSLSYLTFYILPLDGFDLSDELYIKMNARGKQLTEFENFKADLINWLKDDKNPDSSKYQKIVCHHKQKMPYYLMYATKLDTHWTNIFWELCVEDLNIIEENNKDRGENIEENKAIIDPYFQRFWNRYLLNAFIVKNKEVNPIEKTAFFLKFYGKEGEDAIMSYDNFDLHQSIFKQQNVIKESEKVLDALSKNYSILKDFIYPSWSKEGNWNLFAEDINQRQRILFYAVTIYLKKNEFNTDRFKNWMRVVWNIIIDPDIRSVGAMINATKLIDKISHGSNNIYQYLIEEDVLNIIDESNLKSQLFEERLKAQLILSNKEWGQEIIKAESHAMFMGNIGFLLNEDITKSDFIAKFQIAKNLFNSKGSNNEVFEEHLLMRAVLSKIKNWKTLQDFDFEDSHFNWQFLLRKKEWVGKIIDEFCSFSNLQELLNKLKELTCLESKINSWSDDNQSIIRAHNAHFSVFSDGKFHSWLQAHKAIGFKWWDNHLFVRRPRSWYDWVMIDVKRNNIVDHLIKDYSFVTHQSCIGTDYYYGFNVDLFKVYEDCTIKLRFESNGNLKIGFSKAEESIKSQFEIIDEDIENSVIYIKKYNYNDVITVGDVIKFMSTLKVEIFSEFNQESVFYKLKTA